MNDQPGAIDEQMEKEQISHASHEEQQPERPTPDHGATTWNLNRPLARVLGTGAILSVTVLALGIVMALLSGRPHATAFSPAHLLDALRHGQPKGVLGAGLIILIATPIARETVALILFTRHHERPYALIAGAVLTLIALSLVIGAR
ncbi:MAG TPA: DUF1634 domain-containing protein [Chloroflexota bacterium]|nr:DUF1634 domain-containing protein [Chloroflexota bacterium]